MTTPATSPVTQVFLLADLPGVLISLCVVPSAGAHGTPSTMRA